MNNPEPHKGGAGGCDPPRPLAPSSDGYAKPAPKSRRRRSGKKRGKRSGDPGKNLAQIEEPDVIVNHVPDHCEHCGSSLAGAPVAGVIRRQVFEQPPVKVVVSEHRAEQRKCACGCETTAPFPTEAISSAKHPSCMQTRPGCGWRLPCTGCSRCRPGDRSWRHRAERCWRRWRR
ncbi:MAG: hypothetical protein ACRDZ5_01275 [Acidimicrobiales bacterium]